MNQEEVNRKLSCILSMDVAGYSRLMEENEASTVKHLEENKRLITKIIEEYNGRVIDSPGDNLLAEFSSAVKAVDCAVKIQKELKINNTELVESRRMLFRIGINLGDVIEEDGRLYGNGVNIAARLESLADPGGICIARNVYDQVKTKLDLGYEYLGEHNVKNISEPVRVYRVMTGAETAEKVTKKAHGGITSKIAIAVILIIIAGLLLWRFYPDQHTKSEQNPVTPAVKETPKTIAVLPFENLSPEKDQEYFVDGLTEEIINYLSNIPGLQVTSKTSSFAFKGTKQPVKEIAAILDREYILEGGVRKAGDDLRITAQLIRADDDSHIWSETYDRKFKDIFRIQEDIANSVADKLKLTLEASQPGGTENLKAYELYLVARGQYVNGKRKEALESIERAIDLDPEFARAWALACMLHLTLSVYVPADQSFIELDSALNAAKKAVELQPDLGEAYLSLGAVYTRKGEFIEAELAYEKGIKLTTESIDYFVYDLTRHYAILGYIKKGAELLEELRKNDPLQLRFRIVYITNLFILGDIKRAEEEFEQCRAVFKDQQAMIILSGIVFMERMLADKNSLASYKEIFSSSFRDILPSPDDIPPVKDIPEIKDKPDIYDVGVNMMVAQNLESPENALEILHGIYNSDSNLSNADLQNIAIWAHILGDEKLSKDAFVKLFRLQTGQFYNVWHPAFKNFRRTQQFKSIVSKMGLVDYWKRFGWPDLCRPAGDDDFECD